MVNSCRMMEHIGSNTVKNDQIIIDYNKLILIIIYVSDIKSYHRLSHVKYQHSRSALPFMDKTSRLIPGDQSCCWLVSADCVEMGRIHRVRFTSELSKGPRERMMIFVWIRMVIYACQKLGDLGLITNEAINNHNQVIYRRWRSQT